MSFLVRFLRNLGRLALVLWAAAFAAFAGLAVLIHLSRPPYDGYTKSEVILDSIGTIFADTSALLLGGLALLTLSWLIRVSRA